MSILERILIGIGIIAMPILLYAVSGVTEVLVSELLTVPLSLFFFTGKGLMV